MKLFAFAASLREGSVNKQLINHAAKVAGQHGAEITIVDFADIVCPNYNYDDQESQGFPEQSNYFKQLFDEHDGFLLSVPEYNYSIPGTLKNALDWLSRHSPSPTQGKLGYLLSASPSMVGGNRGLWATRQPLEVAGAIIYPSMFSLAQAHDAFAEDGSLKNEQLEQRLSSELETFTKFVGQHVG